MLRPTEARCLTDDEVLTAYRAAKDQTLPGVSYFFCTPALGAEAFARAVTACAGTCGSIRTGLPALSVAEGTGNGTFAAALGTGDLCCSICHVVASVVWSMLLS